MIIELTANTSEGAHAIEKAVKEHTDYDARVVFRSGTVKGEVNAQYTVKIVDTLDSTYSY